MEDGKDLISRQAAIDALRTTQTYKLSEGHDMLLIDQAEAMTELMVLPPAQLEQGGEATFWKKRAREYRDIIFDLVAEQARSVKFDSIEITGEGVAFKKSQPERRWVPVTERLPEDDVEVFVYLFERSAPYIAWVKDCRWYTEDFEVEKENYPTAWMPLPEPWWKEGEEG